MSNKGKAGWPSKTGNKSGGGADNTIGIFVFTQKLTSMKVSRPNDQKSNVKNPNNPQYAADLKNRIRIIQRTLSSQLNREESLKNDIRKMQRELSKLQNQRKGGV